MRSTPKKSMPVVFKDVNESPVAHITNVNDKDHTVDLFWLDKNNVPYKGTVDTDVLEKFNPKSEDK